ncbi:MAG TPA: glycosyltransferase [Conexibacter sp.]|jgi:tetratricopeptide (TPR) repeat protein
MALRLTATTSSRPIAASADVDPIGTLAVELLTSGDLDGYRDLFAQAESIDDIHMRYTRRRTLLEAALEAVRSADPGRVPSIYLAAAGASIAVLEQEPREPLLLNYAGVLFYELWELRGAGVLFDAAARLSPELLFLDQNRRELALRRAAAARTTVRRPAAMTTALSMLARRAERLAKRVRPQTGLKLSLCMIVKDEEEMLPRCLAAAAPAVDEIVIVDTGSTDRTIEIAKSFGARVIEREWTGSFSDARNVSFDGATGDWLLYLDADEVLVEADIPKLRAATGQVWREAIYLNETSYTGELGDGTGTHHLALRMFRARPEYRFSGRLHEQIADKLPTGQPERVGMIDVRIEHYGYLGAVRDSKEKSRRNVELLLAQRDEGDVDNDAFFHFNLGSEYGVLNELENAHAEFELAWQILSEDWSARGFLPTLSVRLVNVLRGMGRYEEAYERAGEALERLPGFTDLVYDQGLSLQALNRVDEALDRFRAAVAMGDAPTGYTALVGAGTFLPQIAIAEITHHLKGDPATAAEMLDACLSEFPGFFGLVLPFVSAKLASGADAEAVVARVEELAELTPTISFLLATGLYEAGETEVAARQYRSLLERQPSNGGARVALAESLLALKRWEEAAQVAAELADDEPFAAAARRSELFARIVGGDLDGAAAVLARSNVGGLDDDDVELFVAWHAVATGAAPGDALPYGAAPLLVTALEALLRVHEFEAFEQLVGLLSLTPVDARERAEVLARMYLRRGFVESAADEWLPIAQADPLDVRALLGLAQVAAAKGMTAEALDFVREAQQLRPNDAVAERLREALEPLAA